ncbi:MAG: hypothetical protein M3Y59_14245 [Myxococcota bacterium]|nr:hypothetical protein [Myxococcota bacterium]
MPEPTAKTLSVLLTARVAFALALARLLLRARIFEPEKMTAEDLQRALPHLEEGLKTFLTKGELASAMEAFRKLAQG